MQDEGYIKFQAHWEQTPPLSDQHPEDLLLWRQRLYDLSLVGSLPDGIGYGNLSERIDDEVFLITGSATGSVAQLELEHLALVESVDVDRNTVWCKGPVVASSESMSHAAVYEALPDVKSVMHIHHAGMWSYWKDRLPTTPIEALYGTPLMARAIVRLLRGWPDSVPGLLVMGGHRDGLIAFGSSHHFAGRCLLAHLQAMPPKKAIHPESI